MSGWEWFAVIAGGASVASLPVAIVLGWFGKRTAVDIHTATQSTLADINKGFRESQQVLSENSKTIAQSVGELGKILERMDQRTAQIQARQEDMDLRWQQAFERMDQRADERHRESLQAIQALKG